MKPFHLYWAQCDTVGSCMVNELQTDNMVRLTLLGLFEKLKDTEGAHQTFKGTTHSTTLNPRVSGKQFYVQC